MRGVCQVRVSRPLARDGGSKVSVIAAPSPVNDLALLPDEVNFNQSPDGAGSHAHMRLSGSCHAREDFLRHSRKNFRDVILIHSNGFFVDTS